MTKQYKTVGIGNAIVDVISHANDSFLDIMGIEKGIMQLVERERAEVLYAAMEDRVQTPGGSVANTLAGLGALGLKTAFIGRVHNDALGRFYADELTKGGTDFVNDPVADQNMPTSRSMIFVSEDGERSMNTYLGISADLGPDDVSEEVVADTELLFLEGYLFDKPKGKEAFELAAKTCQQAGGKAGIALSDPFCVTRHREDFRRLSRELDFVLGNEQEWLELYQTDDLESALRHAVQECGLVACTRSGSEVVVLHKEDQAVIPVNRVVPVDATGAGDQFAAGFLYGIATGQSLDVAGKMGCIAAAEVISHVGPRPQEDVKALFSAAGL
ncbi:MULTISPECIES: adenosine kinase [Halocynthiibacter]|uniref:Adenosine kinase n=1 Tax=Halocynthiibacter halioticoli TaxID=2986804 RepID=A0AAE3IZJ7_9RHOB|nr:MULTISPECIES: adenosine kinase [Halocynthiibacter]MCV6823381.1 adenosine kinase [Halocynthiibacter halioticoli]MCW4056382.1 adenosine kinase [Halocynthiibacter sp. SDUM655004]MDE0590652.1 adenosine kinase [Halocynthiibacter sp. C4]